MRATHNYVRGVEFLAIQQLLGHWTVASAMRYESVRSARVASAIASAHKRHPELGHM
ncbi:MAG: hypothetical protein ACRDTK_00115 [Mycobacterium sp.]